MWWSMRSTASVTAGKDRRTTAAPDPPPARLLRRSPVRYHYPVGGSPADSDSCAVCRGGTPCTTNVESIPPLSAESSIRSAALWSSSIAAPRVRLRVRSYCAEVVEGVPAGAYDALYETRIRPRFTLIVGIATSASSPRVRT